MNAYKIRVTSRLNGQGFDIGDPRAVTPLFFGSHAEAYEAAQTQFHNSLRTTGGESRLHNSGYYVEVLPVTVDFMDGHE